jgi:hypothetical protein
MNIWPKTPAEKAERAQIFFKYLAATLVRAAPDQCHRVPFDVAPAGFNYSVRRALMSERGGGEVVNIGGPKCSPNCTILCRIAPELRFHSLKLPQRAAV